MTAIEVGRRDEPAWRAPLVVLPVETAVQYEATAGSLKQFKAFEKQVVEFFAPMKQRAHETWKTIVAREKEVLDPARAWEVKVKGALAAYDAEQERLRLAEQRRLEAEARRQEEDRRMAEAAALEAEGIAEADEGKLAEAERLIDEPVETPVVIVERSTPQVAGISYRTQYSAVLVDLLALCRHVAQHPEHQGLIALNQVAANQLARSLKENMRLPGLKVRAEKVVASR